MAAYLVKILPYVVGAGCMGSATMALAAWHGAYELNQQNTRLVCEKQQLLRDLDTLRSAIVLEREVAEKEKRDLVEQNRWTTKLVGAGVIGATAVGGLVGYAMR